MNKFDNEIEKILNSIPIQEGFMDFLKGAASKVVQGYKEAIKSALPNLTGAYQAGKEASKQAQTDVQKLVESFVQYKLDTNPNKVIKFGNDSFTYKQLSSKEDDFSKFKKLFKEAMQQVQNPPQQTQQNNTQDQQPSEQNQEQQSTNAKSGQQEEISPSSKILNAIQNTDLNSLKLFENSNIQTDVDAYLKKQIEVEQSKNGENLDFYKNRNSREIKDAISKRILPIFKSKDITDIDEKLKWLYVLAPNNFAFPQKLMNVA